MLAGVTQQRVSRAERGSAAVSLDARCRLAAATGHELAWRLYPVASVRLRDSGQLVLAQAIVGSAHPVWNVQLEVPVAQGDPRAADLVLSGPSEVVHIEIERILVDVQAQLRSGQLKRQVLAEHLQRAVHFVLAVADTRANRARAAPVMDLLTRALPVTSRDAWAAIRGGTSLGGDGILFVRVRGASRGG
jgi:transcriptional regulator with XRE-family HTH domain